MREILFRGKRLDNGEWVYGDLLQSKYSNGDYKTSIMEQAPVALNFKVDPETVGQYTGKIVKTSKLFQDDIGESIDGRFLVRWDEEKAAFVMSFYDYPHETLYLEEMWEDAEIIGNLYDD